MLDYLQNQDGFIHLSLEDYNPGFESRVSLSNGVSLRLLDSGVLEVSPARPSEKAYVLSCGVHGNETAPIEIISHQISKIVTGSIEPKCHLLYILGNPESMRIADRFVSINMNRLFAGAFKSYEVSQETRYEIERAEALEQQVGNFFNKHIGATKTHLDLHTAIKPSFHKTFAIRPFSPTPINPQAKKLLLALGIEAFLQHNKRSTTFSAFSVEKFSAEAYTLELGKVRPFGQNNPDDFKAAISCLDRLVQDQSIPEQHPENLIEYEVIAEIMKNSDEFKFYITDNVENFTAYPRGYLIAEDFDYTYRVTLASESVVFPNINVPIGQRVAVMVRQVDTH